jgi:hypothetical protein
MAMLGEFPACWENFKHSTDIKKKLKQKNIQMLPLNINII